MMHRSLRLALQACLVAAALAGHAARASDPGVSLELRAQFVPTMPNGPVITSMAATGTRQDAVLRAYGNVPTAFANVSLQPFLTRVELRNGEPVKTDVVWFLEDQVRTMGALGFTTHDGATHFVVRGPNYNTITLLGGTPLREIRTFDSPYAIYGTPTVADIDADGAPELVATSGVYLDLDAKLVVLDPETGQLRWTVAAGGDSIVIGQLDTDPALEIITCSTPARIIDGASRQVEYSGPNGMHLQGGIGNADDDPQNEFFDYNASGIRIHEASPLAWNVRTIPVPDNVAVQWRDIDGDGGTDAVIWATDNTVRVLSLRTGAELFRFDVTSLGGRRGWSLADLDGVPPAELLMSSDVRWQVWSLVPVPHVVHEEAIVPGPYSLVGAGELDASPGTDIYVGTGYNLANPHGNLVRIDTASGAMASVAMPEIDARPVPVTGAASADFDGDAGIELAISNGYNLFVLDASDGSLVRTVATDLFDLPEDLFIADTNSDGRDDLVYRYGRGVISRNLANDTGVALPWTIGAEDRVMSVGQFDGDATIELALGGGGLRIYDFGSPFGQPWQYTSEEVLRVVEVNGPLGQPMILGISPDGSYDGNDLVLIDPVTTSVVSRYPMRYASWPRESGLRGGPGGLVALDRSLRTVLVSGAGYVALVDLISNVERARVAINGVPNGLGTNLLTRRLPGGAWEVVVSTNMGVSVLTLDTDTSAFSDGFE